MNSFFWMMFNIAGMIREIETEFSHLGGQHGSLSPVGRMRRD